MIDGQIDQVLRVSKMDDDESLEEFDNRTKEDESAKKARQLDSYKKVSTTKTGANATTPK